MAEKGPIAKNKIKARHIQQISLTDVAPSALDAVLETDFE